MLTEIKREMKEVKRDETPLDKEIEKNAAQIEDLKTNYNKELTMNKTRTQPASSALSTNTLTDPWLLKNDIEYRQSIHQRNISTHKMTGKRRQDTYAAFEGSIVTDLKNLLSNTYEGEKKFQLAMGPKTYDIKTHIDSLEPNKEFGLFVAAHPDRLIVENVEGTGDQTTGQGIGSSSQRSMSQTSERDQFLSDPTVDVVFEGDLLIRKGILLTKSWRKQKCVITGTGYLHVFATDIKIPRITEVS